MVQVIVVDTIGRECNELINFLKGEGLASPMFIGSGMPPKGIDKESVFSLGSASITSCMRAVSKKGEGKRLVFLDSSLSKLPESILKTKLLPFIISKEGAFSYLPLLHNGETIELPEPSVENLPNYLAGRPSMPYLCTAIEGSLLSRFAHIDGTSLRALMMKFFVLAAAEGESVTSHNEELNVEDADIALSNFQLPREEISQCLKLMIDSCNIEDLFPGHAWNAHHAESVAACYHHLAALFYRFGDFDATNECLAYSDQLEESPRSLALKGLMAFKQGETLGAVAQMISSLQQYEIRKQETPYHYLAFTPKNFDSIKSKMEAGLQALNRRDNTEALRAFTQAVFAFDSFFNETGIDSIKDLAH